MEKCLKCVYLDDVTGKCKAYNNTYCCNGQCYYNMECCIKECEMFTPPEMNLPIND